MGKYAVAMATEGDTQVNQASPPHLNSNLDVGQRQTGSQGGLVSSEDNLTTSGWLLIICVLHSEATY